jgi:hypothetical protein
LENKLSSQELQHPCLSVSGWQLMHREHHKLTTVSVLLWIAATILLVYFCFRLMLLVMGYRMGIIGWVEVGALTLVGLILLALGSILDRLSRIVFYLHEHNADTERLLTAIANAGSVVPDEPHLSSK